MFVSNFLAFLENPFFLPFVQIFCFFYLCGYFVLELVQSRSKNHTLMVIKIFKIKHTNIQLTEEVTKKNEVNSKLLFINNTITQ